MDNVILRNTPEIVVSGRFGGMMFKLTRKAMKGEIHRDVNLA